MAKMRAEAREYARKLKDALGDRLRAVVLHGSVARSEAVEGVSDVNLLVLVDVPDPSLLRLLAPRAREWLDRERALPLLFGWEEWQASMDAFAIETADMLEAREILQGEDPLADASVDTGELRLQAERELRGKLVHLREGMLVAADRPEELGRLLLTALPSVATYMRACLRLAGTPVPGTTPAVFRQAGQLLGRDPAGLERLWELRSRKEVPRPEVDDPLVLAVHAALEGSVNYVDTVGEDR